MINIVETMALRAVMWDRPQCAGCVGVTESSSTSAGYQNLVSRGSIRGAGAHETTCPLSPERSTR